MSGSQYLYLLPEPDIDRAALALCAADTSRTSTDASRCNKEIMCIEQTLPRRKARTTGWRLDGFSSVQRFLLEC